MDSGIKGWCDPVLFFLIRIKITRVPFGAAAAPGRVVNLGALVRKPLK